MSELSNTGEVSYGSNIDTMISISNNNLTASNINNSNDTVNELRMFLVAQAKMNYTA